MPALTLPAFAPGRPAEDVDAALRQSLAACDEARRCAVLWFAEVQRRELWCAFGLASMELYAVHRLGFSRNRYWQFKRLADDLERLPALKEAVCEGRVGWTKAQQVARVATPVNQAEWIERAAQCGRRELAAAVTDQVGRARAAARREAVDGSGMGAEGQLALGLGVAAGRSPEMALPATVSLRADALQAPASRRWSSAPASGDLRRRKRGAWNWYWRRWSSWWSARPTAVPPTAPPRRSSSTNAPTARPPP